VRTYGRRVTGVDGRDSSRPGPTLAAVGFDNDWVDTFVPYQAAGMRAARVCAVDRAAVDAAAAAGPLRATFGGTLLRRIAADPLAVPAAGDWAAIRDWPDGRTTVEALLPRRTALREPTASGSASGHLFAANVDLVLVTVSLQSQPNQPVVARLLALARDSGATTVLVVTHADLAADPALDVRNSRGIASGIEVLAVSAVTSHGIARLSELATAGRTVALIGPSGAGKSTLVNRLAGGRPPLAAAAVAGPGLHTTARPELKALPTGALVVDSTAAAIVPGTPAHRDSLPDPFTATARPARPAALRGRR